MKVNTVTNTLPFGIVIIQIIRRNIDAGNIKSCILACFESLGSLGVKIHKKIKVPSEKGVMMFRMRMAIATVYCYL